MAKRITLPDVVVTVEGAVVLFEPQSREAARWLSAECKTELEIHDQVRISKEHKPRVIRGLRQAGFWVLVQK